MLEDKIKHSAEQKYLEHKSKEVNVATKNKHKSLDEELRPLYLMNKQVKQLSGVKGVFIKEAFMFSNMFSWNTSNVFEIYEADAQGKLLHPDSKPILYAVANLSKCCTCNTSAFGSSQIAITTKLSQKESEAPYIFMQEKTRFCGYSSCDIFINEKGNGNLIGTIQAGWNFSLELSSDYVNKLRLTRPLCQFGCSYMRYEAIDADNNQGKMINKFNCCHCDHQTYEIGFPPSYNEDQNTIFLAGVIYNGYVNFQNSNRDSFEQSQLRQIEQKY